MKKALAFVGPFLFLVLCSLQAAHFAVVSFSDGAGKLYLVRKIFIEEVSGAEKEQRIEPHLKRELERCGFTVVDSAKDADAILSRPFLIEHITLDGDGSAPHKSIYQYQLDLPNKETIWKGRIEFVSKPSVAEDNEYAARKISEKLASDWKKSAKKAGIK